MAAMYKDIAFLISDSDTEGHDDDGFPTEAEPNERMVFVNKLSVRSSEFYQASAQGYKPEVQLSLRISEYADEVKLKFNDKLYEVIRTYEKGENIELTCQRWGGVR
ncbi:phage head-tail adapter protein [Lysinibacillus boronitolerans]|nr:phage head-tail adapter protein [Lysinibacillus boronitolerans]